MSVDNEVNNCMMLQIKKPLMIYSQTCTLTAVNQGYRFDVSVYGAIETVGKNFYAQTDLSIAYSPLKYGMLSFETNIKYRNFSLVTTECISFWAGGMIDKNEWRLGITAGLRTFMFCGFGNVTPLAGGEVLYARYISERISLRIKERISAVLISNRTLSTDTFFGFGFSF